MSTIKSSAENLTLNADGANNDIKFQSNGSEVASIDQAGVMTATSFAGSGAALTGVGVDGIVSNADATAITIDSSENVGIGTTSPDKKLDVSGTGNVYAKVQSTNSTAAGINLKTNGGSVEDWLMQADEGANGVAWYNTAYRMTLGNTGDLNINTGDLIFGTAGKGIVLGATSNTDANTLDDYEEGTWTPSVLTGSGVSIGTVYANSYIKIGKVCTLSAAFQVNSSNSPSAYDIRFGGFPFSFAAFDNGGYPISLMYSHNVTPTLFMSRGGYVYYQGTTVGGNNAEPFGSALLNGSNYLSLAFSYHTT
jgi:hypothetical protein